jgi:hypothetical protein
MAETAMRARHSAFTASSWLAALLLLLAVGTAIDLRLSAIWRIAVESVDDPAAQEGDATAPANAPLAHGAEAAAQIAVALRTFGRLTPATDTASSLGVHVVSVPRAPPAV